MSVSRTVLEDSPAPAAATQPMRPAAFCRGLLDALQASDGRRRRRKRDTTPDAIGMSVKRDLLEAAEADDPDATEFEEWLFRRVLAAGDGGGAVQAMALSILDEWRLAAAADDFRAWLAGGARSDDRSQSGAAACQAGVCPPGGREAQ